MHVAVLGIILRKHEHATCEAVCDCRPLSNQMHSGISLLHIKHCNCCFVAWTCSWTRITILVPRKRDDDFPCMKNLLDLEPIKDWRGFGSGFGWIQKSVRKGSSESGPPQGPTHLPYEPGSISRFAYVQPLQRESALHRC
jgi:hypothetical protein